MRPTRWEGVGARGSEYAARWQRLADAGHDVHGEAAFVDALLTPGSRVLDAGCGTGRVALRLAELGHRVTGVDVDPAMLDHARGTGDADAGAAVAWVLADLAGADLPSGPFDLVVAAGNVVPLLAPGSEPAVIAALAARAAVVVAGFGLDAAHLPLEQPPFGLAEYDAWCAAAGLTLAQRYAGWDREPFTPDGGYAVSVHVTTAATRDFPGSGNG